MTKLMSLDIAIERYVADGCSIAMGTALEAAIPFAAGHEIIRQQRHNLTLIGPISDILFDQLIGAACVSEVKAAWVGNVSAGLGHNYRRAVEQSLPHPIEVTDYSNFTLSLALLAGAQGMPYVATHSIGGSDILEQSKVFQKAISPFDHSPVVLVPALIPDVTILHVQRADEEGYAHLWGNLGVSEEAALAARRVIITAEEIVPHEVITSDPNRIITPAFKVAAVCHVPWGCHPSPLPGYYNRDHAFFSEYHVASRKPEGFEAWLKEWVLDSPDQASYLNRLGAERQKALLPANQALAAPVDYGF
ncbi:MAG TPA: CoA-transferase [Chloroflexia bacterium]|nr:CoA-transferase [Chloroflexia bacterium]